MLQILFAAIVCMACLHAPANADNWLSWSEFDKDGENIQIFLSRETGGKTGPVLQITQRGLNLTPTLMETPEALWLAWVDRANRFDYRLRYARIDPQSRNILESGTLATSDRKTYSPSFGLGPDDEPILAWSGLDGEDEEIRLARFSSGRWGNEYSLTSNAFPDTIPLFSKGRDGGLVLSWEQLNEDGIFTVEYTLPENYVANGAASSMTMTPTGKGSDNEYQLNREEASLLQLPPSLQARKDRFLMGSQAPAQK